MGLDRLIRREPLENLTYVTVLQVDSGNRRVQVLGRNNVVQWVSYRPEDFPALEAGHTVATGATSGSAFVVRQVSLVVPPETVLLLV